MRAHAKLDSIVTVVDAKHLTARLDDSHETAEQIAFADTIFINKIDLVPTDALAQIELRIRSINPTAVIHRTERCVVPIDDLLHRAPSISIAFSRSSRTSLEKTTISMTTRSPASR